MVMSILGVETQEYAQPKETFFFLKQNCILRLVIIVGVERRFAKDCSKNGGFHFPFTTLWIHLRSRPHNQLAYPTLRNARSMC